MNNSLGMFDVAEREGRARHLLAAMLLVSSLLIGACESPTEKAASYLAQAQEHYEEGDLVKAEIEVKNTLQIQPKNPEARMLLARIAESRADFSEMAQNLRIAIESKPDFVEARVKLGTLYALGGAIELAEAEAVYLSTNGYDTAETRILNARVYAAKGDLEAGRAELEKALEMEPDNPQALGLLASVAASTDLEGALALIDQGIAVAEDDKPLRLLRIQLLQQAGRDDDVDAEYRQLLTDYPDELALGYQYARYLAEAGRVEEVEPVLRKVIDQDPENVEARLALTQFVAGTRGRQAAEEVLQEFVEEDPEAYELRMALAEIYQQTDRADEAYEQFGVIAEAVPNDDAGLTAKARMAGILLSQEDVEGGTAMLEEVLAIDSMNSGALLLRGALNIDQKNFRAAVGDFRTLLRKEPENKRAQLLIARAHTAAGDSVLAKDAYRRVLEMDPNDGIAPLELARLEIEARNTNAARKILEERLRIQPADARASRTLIAIMVNDKDFGEAEALARKVGELPGQEAIGDYLLGGVYQSQDQHDRAVEAFKKSLNQIPTAREPLQGLVGSLIRLERQDEAVAYLEKLSADYPDNLYAKTLLGQVLAGSGDEGAAQKIFESTLQANENWLPGYTALAGMAGDDISAQIDIYKRGLEAMPESQEMALLLGTAYERTGRIDEAIAAYEEVLRDNPDLPAVANNLAALLADHRLDDASLNKALELAKQFETSDNPAFLDTLGWVYYRLGEYEQGIPYLEEAVERAPKVAVLRYHLGMAYKATGKPSSAKRELEAALAAEGVEFTGIEDARAALAEL
jgi:tetratricopeptide (TPR) repeat protein